MPFMLDGENHTVYVGYEHENRPNYGGKKLNIHIPTIIVPPDGYNGLHVEFAKYPDGSHNALAKTGNDIYHNPEAQKFFEESLKPVLMEKLPSHMKRLIKFDNE